MAAPLVSHSPSDTLRKKRKLVFRWLFTRPSIVVRSPINLRTSLTNELLFCFRPRVSLRPSIFVVPPVSSQLRWLLRRNVTLSATTSRALKNIMDKAWLLDLFTRESHLSIASSAERIVSKWLDHKAIQARKSHMLSNMKQPKRNVSATSQTLKKVSCALPRATKCRSDLLSNFRTMLPIISPHITAGFRRGVVCQL
jgi:hypothetical protein